MKYGIGFCLLVLGIIVVAIGYLSAVIGPKPSLICPILFGFGSVVAVFGSGLMSDYDREMNSKEETRTKDEGGVQCRRKE